MPNARKKMAFGLWLVRAAPALDARNKLTSVLEHTDIQNIKETGIELLKANMPKNQTD
jgi:hypothetical protein